MKIVIQRVSQASVRVVGEIIGEIGWGMVVLIGFSKQDTGSNIPQIVDKILNLRIFEDVEGKMNQSLFDIKGEVLVVSQFTLMGNTKKGRRPNFMDAAPAEVAEKFYQQFLQEMRAHNVPVQTGKFQAHMQVSILNDGPVTILIEN